MKRPTLKRVRTIIGALASFAWAIAMLTLSLVAAFNEHWAKACWFLLFLAWNDLSGELRDVTKALRPKRVNVTVDGRLLDQAIVDYRRKGGLR